jgi:uracil-DNA glycosylase
MSRIFINYRRQDSEGYVGRLYDYLCQHFERGDIFMDIDNIKPGVDFVQTLQDAVTNCDVMLAIIGPQWSTAADEVGSRRLDQWNDFVRIEIATALKQNKLVIPVLVGRAQMPSPKELPEDLSALVRRNAVELSHQRFAYDVERLASAIKQTIPANRPAKPQSDVDSDAGHASDVVRQKEALLKAVRADLLNATSSPLYSIRSANGYYPVLGEGNADANIMFIGESPGKNEAEQGRPFCGPSGEVLEEMLNGIQLKRQDVYVTNLVLDHPGAKREPTIEEMAYYAPFVDRIIDIIQPAVIATLGRFSMQYLLKKLDLPEKKGLISELHGKLIKTKLHYGEIHVVPLYHPAVVLYSASQKETLRKDFAKLRLFL